MSAPFLVIKDIGFQRLAGADSVERKEPHQGQASLLFMDEDLNDLSCEQLIDEVKRLRAGIRQHRDNSGHDLCWHHPELWGLLPERTTPNVAVPPWPKFLRGCVKYRESLDRELPNAPAADVEYE